MSAERYNKKSMSKYGGGPADVGLPPNATLEEITSAVIDFQNEMGLSADGKVGPVTHRRILADRELNREQCVAVECSLLF